MTTAIELAASLDPDQPLLLLDADEVLLRFVETLEAYLLTQNAELRLDSYQLNGNIYLQDTGDVASSAQIKILMDGFLEACIDNIPLIRGACDALDKLANYYQIAILTNVPADYRQRRENNLKAQGLNFPVIANDGGKGPGAGLLARAIASQTVFVDDLPPQLASVAAHAPEIHRVHFIGDPRLSRMIGKAPDAHVRFDEWHALRPYLEQLAMGRIP